MRATASLFCIALALFTAQDAAQAIADAVGIDAAANLIGAALVATLGKLGANNHA